jgi:hypothetical protein
LSENNGVPVDEAGVASDEEKAIDLSDLLNLLRETLIEHEVRLMNIESFLGTLMENIKAEMEASIEEVTEEGPGLDESPEHPPV